MWYNSDACVQESGTIVMLVCKTVGCGTILSVQCKTVGCDTMVMLVCKTVGSCGTMCARQLDHVVQ